MAPRGIFGLDQRWSPVRLHSDRAAVRMRGAYILRARILAHVSEYGKGCGPWILQLFPAQSGNMVSTRLLTLGRATERCAPPRWKRLATSSEMVQFVARPTRGSAWAGWLIRPRKGSLPLRSPHGLHRKKS